ncbi:hypothetical protein [Candidatus Mycoplasma haematohominis]|uniref:hypothetical protein n=1 Tax=Candidatus Mycoplasma haematohominis TaxID=1494318 RepID=UPI001C0A689C|nr:hypothetical protein [Candidatus Mycoplasma haemohominis]
MDPLKGAVGAGAVALIVAGGVGAAYINNEPTAFTLSSKEIGTVSFTNGNIGNIEANKSKLVADHEKNKDWFNWVYKNKLSYAKEAKEGEASKLSTEFQAVTEGYGTGTTTSLNKVCDAAYKKNKTDFEGNNEPNKVKYKADVEKFCIYKESGQLDLGS